MQVWNIYLTVTLTHNPLCALELQHIITSANQYLPLKAWLQYDGQFCMLIASNTHLRWDYRTQNCDMKPWQLPIPKGTKNDGQVPIAGLRIISLTTALACPFVTAHNTLSQLIAKHPALQYAAILTTDSAQKAHALSSTFACHARAPTLVPLVSGVASQDLMSGHSSH